MRVPHRVSIVLALTACPQPEPPQCGEFEEVFVWADEDGDGFGRDEPIGYVCQPAAGQAPNNADCDDTNADVNPAGVEVCDLADNDCNQRVDETEPKVPWYHDADADGFGSDDDIQSACQIPGPDWLPTSGDCDDTNADVNPGMIEICNAGIDDDCDSLSDDQDGGVDPTTYTNWYRDSDLDGFGDPLQVRPACAAPPGAIADGTDCDDVDAAVNPAASEICDRIDNDCDTLTDDADDSIDPTTQDPYYGDADGDGYGDPAVITLACEPLPGIGVENDDDCDDTDPLANIPQDWYLDTDGDGAGSGSPLVFQCLNPGAGTGPESHGIDCDPDDPAIFPLQLEDCFDGVDQNCNAQIDCQDQDCAAEPTCVPPCADFVITEPPLPTSANGSTVGMGNDFVPGCLGGGTAPDVVFHFVPQQTRQYTINTIGSNYDTALYVKPNCGPIEFACNDDFYGLQSRVLVNLNAGVPVLIVVDGYSSSSGNYVLNIQ